MSQELRIYGASDDLVEFEGAFSEEYNVCAATGTIFMVRIDYPSFCQIFTVRAAFGRGWNLSLGQATGQPEEGAPLRVTFGSRPYYEDDPMIIIHDIEDNAEVRVEMLS